MSFCSKTNIVFLSLKIDFVLANSEDLDEMPHLTAFHLGLHCLPKYPFWASLPLKGKTNILQWHDRMRQQKKHCPHMYSYLNCIRTIGEPINGDFSTINVRQINLTLAKTL